MYIRREKQVSVKAKKGRLYMLCSGDLGSWFKFIFRITIAYAGSNPDIVLFVTGPWNTNKVEKPDNVKENNREGRATIRLFWSLIRTIVCAVRFN